MQHMVLHLLQDTSIAYLTRHRLADPALARLAVRIHRHGQEHVVQLQGWLAELQAQVQQMTAWSRARSWVPVPA